LLVIDVNPRFIRAGQDPHGLRRCERGVEHTLGRQVDQASARSDQEQVRVEDLSSLLPARTYQRSAPDYQLDGAAEQLPCALARQCRHDSPIPDVKVKLSTHGRLVLSLWPPRQCASSVRKLGMSSRPERIPRSADPPEISNRF